MGYSVFPAASTGGGLPSSTLKQTFSSTSNSVSIPAGTNVVYAAVWGGGGGAGGAAGYWYNGSGNGGGSGAAGGFAFGQTPISTVALVGAAGAGGSNGGFNGCSPIGGGNGSAGGTSRYGAIVASGGNFGNQTATSGNVGSPSKYGVNIDISGINVTPGAAGAASAGSGGAGYVALFY